MNPRDVCLQSVYADIEIGIRTSEGETGQTHYSPHT